MSDHQKKRPSHRVSFAPFTGTDDSGDDKLGNKREIGAVWPRKNGGGIIRLDIIPIELTQRQGVLFLEDVPANGGDTGQ